MRYVKFNKTLCGVDFLLNVLDLESSIKKEWLGEVRCTDFFQILFIEKGDGKLLLNETEIDVVDNSIIFISQNQNHYWKFIGDRFEGKCLVFQEEFLNDFFADQYFTFRLLYFYQTKFPLILKVENTVLENYLSKLIEIKKELVNPQTDSVHLIRSVLYYTLITLNRVYAENNGIKTAIATNNLAYHFRQLVEENILSKQRIEEYADLMKISRITLNKAVKAQFNVTVSDFLKSKLIFEIKMKLIYSNKSVLEISNDLNFSEANHMSRFFKNKEGVSPIEYKLGYQNGMYS